MENCKQTAMSLFDTLGVNSVDTGNGIILIREGNHLRLERKNDEYLDDLDIPEEEFTDVIWENIIDDLEYATQDN